MVYMIIITLLLVEFKSHPMLMVKFISCNEALNSIATFFFQNNHFAIIEISSEVTKMGPDFNKYNMKGSVLYSAVDLHNSISKYHSTFSFISIRHLLFACCRST